MPSFPSKTFDSMAVNNHLKVTDQKNSGQNGQAKPILPTHEQQDSIFAGTNLLDSHGPHNANNFRQTNNFLYTSIPSPSPNQDNNNNPIVNQIPQFIKDNNSHKVPAKLPGVKTEKMQDFFNFNPNVS